MKFWNKIRRQTWSQNKRKSYSNLKTFQKRNFFRASVYSMCQPNFSRRKNLAASDNTMSTIKNKNIFLLVYYYFYYTLGDIVNSTSHKHSLSVNIY